MEERTTAVLVHFEPAARPLRWLRVLFGNGDGTTSPRSYRVAAQPRGLALFDANGDNHMDAVTANRNASNLSLLMNQGDGSLSIGIPSSGFANLNRNDAMISPSHPSSTPPTSPP